MVKKAETQGAGNGTPADLVISETMTKGHVDAIVDLFLEKTVSVSVVEVKQIIMDCGVEDLYFRDPEATKADKEAEAGRVGNNISNLSSEICELVSNRSLRPTIRSVIGALKETVQGKKIGHNTVSDASVEAEKFVDVMTEKVHNVLRAMMIANGYKEDEATKKLFELGFVDVLHGHVMKAIEKAVTSCHILLEK